MEAEPLIRTSSSPPTETIIPRAVLTDVPIEEDDTELLPLFTHSPIRHIARIGVNNYKWQHYFDKYKLVQERCGEFRFFDQ